MDARLDGPTPAPPVPIDATVFAVSKGTTLAMLLALLMALAEASVLLFHAWFTADPTTRITQVREGIFCLLVAELNWRFIFRSWHRIAVNANGSGQNGGAGPVTLIGTLWPTHVRTIPCRGLS